MSGKTLNYWWSENLFWIEEDCGWTPLIIYTEDSLKQFTVYICPDFEIQIVQ